MRECVFSMERTKKIPSQEFEIERKEVSKALFPSIWHQQHRSMDSSSENPPRRSKPTASITILETNQVSDQRPVAPERISAKSW